MATRHYGLQSRNADNQARSHGLENRIDQLKNGYRYKLPLSGHVGFIPGRNGRQSSVKSNGAWKSPNNRPGDVVWKNVKIHSAKNGSRPGLRKTTPRPKHSLSVTTKTAHMHGRTVHTNGTYLGKSKTKYLTTERSNTSTLHSKTRMAAERRTPLSYNRTLLKSYTDWPKKTTTHTREPLHVKREISYKDGKFAKSGKLDGKIKTSDDFIISTAGKPDPNVYIERIQRMSPQDSRPNNDGPKYFETTKIEETFHEPSSVKRKGKRKGKASHRGKTMHDKVNNYQDIGEFKYPHRSMDVKPSGGKRAYYELDGQQISSERASQYDREHGNLNRNAWKEVPNSYKERSDSRSGNRPVNSWKVHRLQERPMDITSSDKGRVISLPHDDRRNIK